MTDKKKTNEEVLTQELIGFVNKNFFDLQMRESKGGLLFGDGVLVVGKQEGKTMGGYVEIDTIREAEVKKILEKNKKERKEYLFVLLHTKCLSVTKFKRTFYCKMTWTQEMQRKKKLLEIKKKNEEKKITNSSD